MEILKNIKKGIFQGIGIVIVLLLSGVSYAAWTLLPTELPNATLTSDKWNAVIDRLNSIDQRQLATAWVDFNGTSAKCPLTSGEYVCAINASYNISKVTRTQAGVYTVFFTTPMDNLNYMFSGLGQGNGTSTAYVGYRNDLQIKTLDKVNVTAVGNDNLYYDNADVMVTFFGGKNY